MSFQSVLSELPLQTFTPEEKILLSWLRLSPPTERERLSLTSLDAQVIRSIPEERWAKSVLTGRLAPLIQWFKISKNHWNQELFKHLNLSPQTWALFKSYHQQSWLASIQREQILQLLAIAFKKANKQFILYKGSAYCFHLYEESSLRVMADIDMLIFPHQFKSIQHLLEDLGYELHPHSEHFSSARTFINPKNKSQLDVHFRMDGRQYLSHVEIEELMKNPVLIGDNLYGLPPVEEFLLHIFHQCRHAFTYQSVPLISWIEGRELFLRVIDQWTQLLELAEHWRLKQVLNISLWILDEIFEGLIPQHITFKKPLFGDILSILRHDWQNSPRMQQLNTRLLPFLFLVEMIDEKKDKLAYINARLLNIIK